jgi:uncharacterized protein (TIGR03437 family)
MFSIHPKCARVAQCPTFATFRHIQKVLVAASLAAGTLLAQTTASITSTPLNKTNPVEFGPAIVDSAGNLYFRSSGPTTAGAIQTQTGGGQCLVSNGFFDSLNPCPDAYVGKLDPSGNLVFGTFLGGNLADTANALAVDTTGNVFIAGNTGGSFPTTSSSAIPSSTTSKAFVAKVSADGTRLIYSTYLPDTAASASGIAIDSTGAAYVTGNSTTGHAFVIKVSADGSSFGYNTALAGGKVDSGDAITADSAGNVVVTGHTTSTDFPVTTGAFQGSLKGTQNVFVARLDTAGHTVFATYVGGSGTDLPQVIKMDSSGNVYVAGATSSADFPSTAGSFEPTAIVPLWNSFGPGGFAFSMKSTGALNWSTAVESNELPALQQGVTQLALGTSGDVYVAGIAGAGYPVTASAPQPCFDGSNQGLDAFVVHLDSRGALLDASYAGKGPFVVEGFTANANGPALVTNDSNGTSETLYQLHFGAAGSTPAPCMSLQVLNSASMSGYQTVVPGELITLTGFGIGPDTGVVSQRDAQNLTPRQAGGVQVLFNGQPAPVLYAQSRQINAMVPVELSGTTQTAITVVYNGTTFGPINATVAEFGVPGFFRQNLGVSSQAGAVNQDGTLNSAGNPVARGSVISLFGTGFGLTAPACPTGGINPPGAISLKSGLGISIVSSAGVNQIVIQTQAQYAGNAPGLPCGVTQANIVVPTTAQPGVFQFLPESTFSLSFNSFAIGQGSAGGFIYIK